ncbi:PAN2-PAN3 deadenylation complex subunit pan3 [Harmonia axyridis]|uniref:PAN2-PAN3 deadenylation complex subunit pan3 n=1 Tax=Harmonia axyridis TaxID=115357 RepID=UPI001E277B87|nr:PAN2-PAN3 deadenylation complex subunit pan3 [Harmonia axyridis]
MRDFCTGAYSNYEIEKSIFNIMDHSMYMRYSPSNGVPQESKLANYMTSHADELALRQSFSSKLNLGPSGTPKKSLVHNSEFIPKTSSTSPSSSLYLSYGSNDNSHLSFSSAVEDIEHISSHVTPESSSPPNPVNSSMDLLEKSGSSIPYQENVGGTTYFYHSADPPPLANDSIVSNVINSEYKVYPGTPSHVDTLKRKEDHSFFVSENIRAEILSQNMLTLMLSDPQVTDLPQEIDSYHELCPLEPISNTSVHKGYQTSMYKATHTKTGVHYCLRRIHGFRLQHTKSMMYVDIWKKLMHSNIVQLKEVFTTKAFGDNSLIFVYDFHPGSETLLNKHFSTDQNHEYCDPFLVDNSAPRPYSHQKNELLRYQANNKLPEPLIWNYIIQLTSALRVIHSNNLACRSLDPTKIILTSKNRLRLSCLGVMDVICFDPNSINQLVLMQHYQQEDLMALGKLVLALACKSTTAVQRENISMALDIVGRSYTPDLRNLIMYLLSSQPPRRSVTDLMPMIGARFYTQLDNLQNNMEVLQNELSKEIENGRLFRLLSKLSTINERPELNLDAAWSETGDRYMLKLFRDYVFHQVTEEGRPWIDMAHIVQCLNKLDAGVPEKVCLMSRDEQSILVVSYSELKRCLDQSFEEIANAALIDDCAENKM